MKALLVLLFLLAGCGISGPRQAATWYTLNDQGSTAAVARPWVGTLLVGETEVPEFYQSRALAFSRTPGTRGHYQYARLTDSPAAAVAEAIRQRLGQSAVFTSVAAAGSGVSGEYRLNTRLLDFFHEAEHAPGQMKLVLEVELVQRQQARLLARTRIETTAPCATYDARGAAAASNVALTQALNQLTVWLAELPR